MSSVSHLASISKISASKGGISMPIQSLIQSEPELTYQQISPYCECRRPKHRNVVYVVGAELLLRETLFGLSGLIDLGVLYFDSPQQFVEHSREDESSCLILDLCSRDQENFGLQCQLAAKASPPVVFIC